MTVKAEPAWMREQRQVRKGVPFKRFKVLQAKTGVPARKLLKVVSISESTLERRRKSGTFEPPESERILRVERLMDLATRTFEDADKAREWFNRPNLALGDQAPLQAVDTEPGARMVEDVLHRIEHGIYG